MDPELRRRFDQSDRNLRWFDEHAVELDIINRYRGKHIAVAGGELFVADTPLEVRRLATEKHLDDSPLYYYISKNILSHRQLMDQPQLLGEVPMPPELARKFDQAAQNLRWFDEHAADLDVFNRYRGKHIAVAGGELFVADSPAEARRMANEKHPDDSPHVRYILKEKTYRIYAF